MPGAKTRGRAAGAQGVEGARLVFLGHAGEAVEVALTAGDGGLGEFAGELVGNALADPDGALHGAGRERYLFGGFLGPARVLAWIARLGGGAAPVAAAPPVGVEVEIDLLALGEEAGPVERRQVGAHQVLVNFDEAVLSRVRVDDDGLDLRQAEAARRLDAMRAGDQDEERGIVGVGPDGDPQVGA